LAARRHRPCNSRSAVTSIIFPTRGMAIPVPCCGTGYNHSLEVATATPLTMTSSAQAEMMYPRSSLIQDLFMSQFKP
jgi:hypothetical protein